MFDKALYLLAAAAVVGVYMAIQHSRGKTPPPAIAAILHGLLAVSGVVLLLLGVLRMDTGNLQIWSLCLFAVAALGGLYLVSHHIRGKPLPGGVIVIHGLIAATAFVILALAVFMVG